MSTASTRRADAVNELARKWYDDADVYVMAMCGNTRAPSTAVREYHANTYLNIHRAELAAKIRGLATLGRTERWRNAIEEWAHQIETEQQSSLRWALMQYYVYALHAA